MKRALSGDIYIQTKAAKLRLTERWVGPGTSARLETRTVGLAEHLFVPRGTGKSGELCKSHVLTLYVITRFGSRTRLQHEA